MPTSPDDRPARGRDRGHRPGALFTEISGPGVTLERTVEEASRSAQAAERSANEPKETVQEVTGDLAEGIAVPGTRSVAGVGAGVAA